MKSIAGLFGLVLVALLISAGAFALPDTTVIREAAAVTTSNVLATTVTQPLDATRDIEVFCDFTSQPLTNCVVTISAAKTSKLLPSDTTDWFIDPTTSFTVSTTSKQVFLFPKTMFQRGEPIRIGAQASGTVTSSSLSLSSRFR